MISIIMPVYNGREFISDAITSTLNQTYENFELIIVNDGSTDDSELTIKRIVDRRIRYFFKVNGGEASARNFGLSKAKGDIITFLDCDDIMKVDRLEKQHDFLINNNLDAVYTSVTVIDKDKNNLYNLKSELVVEDYKNYFPIMLYRQIIPATATFMMRRKIIDDGVRYPDQYTNAVDYSFSLEVAKNYKIGYLDNELYYYRRHNNNLTNKHKEQLNTEVNIVKSIDINIIKNSVQCSTLGYKDKVVLLGKIYMKIEEYVEAKEVLLNIEEKDEYIFFYLGNIYYHLKNYEEAKGWYEEALELNSSLAEVYNNLGVVELYLGNYELSKELIKKALAINSSYMDAKFNLSSNSNLKITKKELRKVLTIY